MNRIRGLSAAYGIARVGFGVFVSSAPALVGRTWIGKEADRPRAGVILRALGLRDIALGAGLAHGGLKGDARAWLAVTMLSDLGDVSATLIGRDRLDPRDVALTTMLAGSGALAAAILLAASGGAEE